MYVIERPTGSTLEPLTGVLAVEALSHRCTVSARVAITDLPDELAGQSLDLWGHCLRADNWAALAEPSYLCLPVRFHPALKSYTFDVPVGVCCLGFGHYEIVIYAGRAVIVRVPLVVTLELLSPRQALDAQGQLVN